MATKTISIMDDAYYLLLKHKLRNESFSHLIRRSFSKKEDIMKFAGAWESLDEKTINSIKEEIESAGLNATKDLLKKKKHDMH